MPTSSTLNHPLEDPSFSIKLPDPCILVIFGATGDLTARKLVPALYNLALDNQLPSHFACVGFARRDKSNEVFRQEMHDAITAHSRTQPIDEEVWKNFSQHLYYHCSEFHHDEGYEELKTLLHNLDHKLGTQGNRIYYLSTQPSFFATIIQNLSKHQLIYDHKDQRHWSRVIIEKPFGHDLQSAVELQTQLSHYLHENQIYRIDHYLGKETVQNLFAFRFANPIFESLWDKDHIDNIQITVAEEQGIGTRGRLWEEAGMLRDIIQNHVMQLLALVGMEPPINFKADSIRNEKVKLLKSIRPIPYHQISENVVRGQYSTGYINSKAVKSYREEENVDPHSNVETYAALQLFVDNWRWAGVPFYLRAGKRLPKRVTEISITFKNLPAILFHNLADSIEPNVLVIRIQPDEGISLKINCKVPGLSLLLQPVKMDFRYGSYFGLTSPEAYERLICDCMIGDNTLFARDDEVLTSWELLTPILHYWASEAAPNFPNYASGSWGPEEANELLIRNGRSWRLN